MAGMKFNADIDLKNIVKLRQEIDKLKKSLIEIASVPNSDAAIKQLESEIDRATKKLSEYKDSYAKLQKIKYDIDSSNSTVKRVKEETSALQSTNKWIIANTESVKEADRQIKQLKKDFSALSDEEKVGDTGTAKIRQIQQLAAQRLVEEEAVRKTIKAQKDQIIQSNAEEGSITALRKQLILLIKDYDDLGRVRRGGDSGKALLTQISNVQKELNAAEQASGRFQRNVGNYASAWNGLGFSVQQVARELPSLAVSANTFFLAISNNIPILVDEIAKARKEYAAFKAELAAGNKDVKAVAPVWQQLTKSLISWQTALVVGLTLLSVYGKDVIKWIGSLGKAEEAIKNLYTAQRDLYNVTSTGIEQSSKEITKLNSLYKIATDVTRTTKERNDAVKELKRSFPSHLKNLSDESIKNGEVAKSIKEQTRQIIANAKASVAADQIAKNWYKSFQAGVAKNIALLQKQRLEQNLLIAEQRKEEYSTINNPGAYDWASKQVDLIKESIEETDKEIKKQEALQDSYQKSSKALEKLVTVAGLGGKYEDPDKNYNSILDQQKKIADLLDQQALERKRKEEDIEYQTSQAKIDAMAEGEAKIRAQRDLDNKKEIQDLERQREDYIRTEIEYQRKLFDAREELNVKKNKNYKKKTFDPSSVKVDTSSIDATIGYVSKRQINDQIRNQEEAWNEYIIKYGTFQQKKEAITRKYTDAINKAANAGEASSLQKEFEEALANLDLSKLKDEINWEMIFGSISKATKEQLTKIKKQLQEFKKSPEFKNATPEQIQVIETAINSINDALVDKGGFFGGLSNSLTEYEDAVNKVKEAQEELNKALETGDEVAIEKAQKKKNAAENTQANAQTNVEKSRDKAISNITAVAHAMKQLGSAEFNLSSFGSAVGGLVDALSESGSKIGGIIAAILSLLDEFGKDGGVEFGKNIVNNVISAIGGTIEVPFKMLGIDLGLGGANYSDYNEMVAKYDVLLDVWDQLLDKKKAYINESYGAEATKAGKEALDLLKAERDITRELASSRLDAGASAGSHSMAYRMWKGSYKYEGQNWKDVAGEISSALGGVEFSSMWNLLYMSADQLEWIKTNYSGLWSQMDTDFRGYLDDIIQYGETEAEIIESVKEQITGISFDSFRDSYVSLLSDLDSTNKDFADSFEEYLRKSILQSVIAKNYDTKIQELYDSWSKAGEDGVFSEPEIGRLRAMQQSITDAMLAERDRLEEVFGWSSSSSQEASKKGFATASQDSIDELNGRFTALQIAGEEIKNQNQLQTMSILELRADMLPIIANTTGIKDIASETRDLLRLSYEAIVDIRDNTNVIVKPIQQMASDIAEVKRNTSKL